MGRIRRGLHLLRRSARVLRTEPQLWVFPLAAFATFVILFAGLFIAIFRRLPEPGDFRGSRFLMLYPVMIVAGIPATFMNAALIGAASVRLRGGDPTITSGLRMAWQRAPQLLGWSLLNGLSFFLLQLIASRLKVAGRLVTATLGMSWALATMFVIPVLLFEPVKVPAAVRRSAMLFKQRWGEGVAGAGSLGLALAILFIPVGVALAFAAASAPNLFVVWFAVYMGVLTVIAGALGGVFNAALYQYAVDGTVALGFTGDELAGAYVPKSDTMIGGLVHPRPADRLSRRARLVLVITWVVGVALMPVIPLVTGNAHGAIPGPLGALSFVLVIAAIVASIAGWRNAPQLSVIAALFAAGTCVFDGLRRPALGAAEILVFVVVAEIAQRVHRSKTS